MIKRINDSKRDTWLDKVKEVKAYGVRYWSKYQMDGGLAWILVELPNDMRLPVGKRDKFLADQIAQHNSSYQNKVQNWLRYRIDIDSQPCTRPGGYFKQASKISIVGKRCLITFTFGWDV